MAVAGGVPPAVAGVWLWCEVATAAIPALAPAMANTLSAASTGVQPRPPRKTPRQKTRAAGAAPVPPGLKSLATRNATSSTVTRRGGSGVTRCSISASCLSSVFMRSHLRS